MITWLSPYSYYLYLLCELTKWHKNCRKYLLQAYGHCFINLEYNRYSLLRLPRFIWAVITGGDTLVIDTSLEGCRHLDPEQDDVYYLPIIPKLLFTVGTTTIIAYGIYKIVFRIRH